jgi:hypothetical protein
MGHNPQPPAILTTTSSNINVNVCLTVSCSAFVLARSKTPLSPKFYRYFLSSHVDACYDSVKVVLIGIQIQKHVNSKEDSKCGSKVC